MIVVKVGGSLGIDYDAVCSDLASIVKAGRQAILVHGGSAETNRVSEKLGKPPRMVTSVSGYESRYTDRETLEIFEMVYCGKMNKGIVKEGILGVLKLRWMSMFKNYRKNVKNTYQSPAVPYQSEIAVDPK